MDDEPQSKTSYVGKVSGATGQNLKGAVMLELSANQLLFLKRSLLARHDRDMLRLEQDNQKLRTELGVALSEIDKPRKKLCDDEFVECSIPLSKSPFKMTGQGSQSLNAYQLRSADLTQNEALEDAGVSKSAAAQQTFTSTLTDLAPNQSRQSSVISLAQWSTVSSDKCEEAMQRWTSLMQRLLKDDSIPVGTKRISIEMNVNWHGVDLRNNEDMYDDKVWKKDTMQSDTHSSRQPPCTLHPHSTLVLGFRVVSLIALSWDLIVTPLQQFDLGVAVETTLDQIGLIISAYWLGELFSNFFIGFERAGRIEMRRRYIARQYAKTLLIPDVALVTLDLILLVFTFQAQSRTGSVKSLKMMRTPRLLRLLRLLRVNKLRKAVHVVVNSVQNMYLLLAARILSGLLLLLLVNHFIACAFMSLGFSKLGRRSWIQKANLEFASISEIYITALHWSTTQFMPATNDISPANGIERFFTVCITMLAMGVFSSFISSITNAVNSMRAVRNEQIKKETALRKFFSERQLSTDLFLTVQDFCQKAGVRETLIQEDEVSLLSETPDSIRMRLHSEMYMPKLNSAIWMLPDVRDMDAGLLRQICHTVISERLYRPQTEIFIRDAVCRKTFVTLSSHLQYSLTAESFEDVSEGVWICEAAFFAVWYHHGFLITSCSSRILELDVDIFVGVITSRGGKLCKFLQTFGVLLVGFLETQLERQIELTDLPLDSEKVADLADRALRFRSAPAGNFHLRV
eukprot:TRINITY_DN9097_c0_g2_i1.p1 TRINITY_DN9097_c0_g2~~TRINITY_DN9097_c0_g2_i1.p1  ORF type:complete len:752 (-),score=105.52 TRINITY_DN9097_c0_g2_i1:109-2334(-)